MNNMMSLPFKPRARLLLQLGDQLIRNERIALFELVKNAYDADASVVQITMRHVDDEETGEIIVEDDGIGMDNNVIVNAWMEPGTDNKAKEFEARKRTPRFQRLPIGEKGIGRFAAHKLGNVIELTTRMKGCQEIVVKIDWRVFESEKYLSGVSVDIEQRDPQTFKDRTGTKIRITKLRSLWDRGMVRDAYRSVTSIVNPFESGNSKFQIKFDCPDIPDLLEGLMKPEEIQDFALWHATCDISADNFSMHLEFNPWAAMKGKIDSREKTLQENLLDPEERKVVNLDLALYRIGSVRMELYVFDRDPQVMKLLIGSKRQLENYLNNNGGVRVYRDGIRVYDYGEKGNDWLDLGLRRVNEPTTKISNNIVVAAVFLNRDGSEDLIEKTNREGFVENNAYQLFRKAVLFAVTRFENERYIDKSNIRAIFGPTPKTEPVIAAFNELRNKIKEKIQDEKLRKELGNCIDRVETDYNEIRENLLKSSGAGLSLSIVIHEFEKVVKELLLAVDREKSSDRIVTLVRHLEKLLEGFTALVRRGRMQSNDLKDITKQAIFNVGYRLEAHKIQIIDGFSNAGFDTTVRCVKNYVLMVLMNILDNSIWWLDRKYGKKEEVKKIYVKISNEIPEGTAIVIADNGPGFTISTDDAVKPFITTKPGGMGLGLYIAEEIMKAHGGELIFPEKGDVTVPIGMGGATVGLLFKGDTK
jgi:signal transduction histidine kinase